MARAIASNPPDKNKRECNKTCLPDESGIVVTLASRGEARGVAPEAGARGAGLKETAALCLLGDPATACLALMTPGDKPGGRKLDIAG